MKGAIVCRRPHCACAPSSPPPPLSLHSPLLSVSVAPVSTWQLIGRHAQNQARSFSRADRKGRASLGIGSLGCIRSGCCPAHPRCTQRHGALLIPTGRQERSAILPSSHIGSVAITGGLTMSARAKGILTKDSVSLLPCFYFVEVGWCCMLLIQRH